MDTSHTVTPPRDTELTQPYMEKTDQNDQGDVVMVELNVGGSDSKSDLLLNRTIGSSYLL